MGPFLLLEHRMHHPPTSWKFACSEQVVSPSEMRLLAVLEPNKSKGGVLETHDMTITDKSAVKNAVCNLRSKVAKYI
jgi:hypothetical protein